MSEVEKLLKYICVFKDYNINISFEEAIVGYILENKKDFSASRLLGLVNTINQTCICKKVDELEAIKAIAHERAIYLEAYLSGEMWKDEESAKRNLQPQINNARRIIEVCK